MKLEYKYRKIRQKMKLEYKDKKIRQKMKLEYKDGRKRQKIRIETQLKKDGLLQTDNNKATRRRI